MPASMISGRGSSPLTRGKRDARFLQYLDRGLIPAHAGKTTCSAASASICRAHPRSRGENSAGAGRVQGAHGSSPLTRGKRLQNSSGRCRCRLIPAHAGKTRWFPATELTARAHPRSRGENPRVRSPSAAASGSSPLTRGKQSLWKVGITRIGLIPAHAGKTRFASVRTIGGHGSSPLTRGKLERFLGAARDCGLIPAHAGKTDGRILRVREGRAHPRSRGENTRMSEAEQNRVGSSPLTRGKHRRQAQHPRKPGLIPAHAGKTIETAGKSPPPAAHPRSRGEN